MPLLEMLSKMFNGDAVKGCQQFMLNLYTISKSLTFKSCFIHG